MTRLFLLVAAFAGFAGSITCLYLAEPKPAHDLWTETPVINCGDLSQSQEVHVQFEVVNNFPNALDIFDVFRECGCSAVELSTKHLEPGERTYVNVTWKTGASRGYRGINLGIFFNLGDGRPLEKSLRVEGNIIPDIAITPEKMTFVGDKPEKQAIRFSPGRAERFKIRRVSCNHSAFKAQMVNEHLAEVTFDGVTPIYANGLQPILIVETDSLKEPEITVPLELRLALPSQ